MSTSQLRALDGRVVLDPERLKALRKKLGLSQSALAERCFDRRLCVSVASIKRAETLKSVLYRTARHLAEVYEIDLDSVLLVRESEPDDSQTQSPMPVPMPTPVSAFMPFDFVDKDQETRAVIGLFLSVMPPPGLLLNQLIELVRQFGGTLPEPPISNEKAEGLLALFGVPRAYRSDGLRCMQCALEVAALLQAHASYADCYLAIDRLEWQAMFGPIVSHARLSELQVPPRLEECNDRHREFPVFVERGLTQLVAERFVFAPTEGEFRRYLYPLRTEQVPNYALTGRDIEVRQLKAILEVTVAYQAGHVVYIRGVAGIGKTRLANEFADMAQQNLFNCHSSVVLDFGDGGETGLIGQLVRSLLRVQLDAENLELQLTSRLQKMRLSADDAMFYRALMGLPQTAGQAAVFAAMAHTTRSQRQIEALRALLLREAMDRPAVIVVEDVHWACGAMLDLLGTLMQQVTDASIIWVLTSRVEQDPLESALRPHLTDLPVTVFDLAPLRSAAASTLSLQFPDTDPGYRNRCVARAQGNPLFLTQLLLAGQSRVLPESLQNLVRSKLDQLTPLDRRALRIAAVIGQRFSLNVLCNVLGTSAYVPELPQRHYLVRQVEPGVYQFIHDLILQGIYETMAPVQREYLHAQLALQYVESDTVLCAQHLYKARSDQAPEKFLQAVEEMIENYQYDKALELINQCQSIDYASKDDHMLSMLAGNATLKMGLTQEARVHYESAMKYARCTEHNLDATLGLARTLNVLEELEAEEALLDQAIPPAQSLGAHTVLANLYYLKGNIYFPRGNFARCRQLHELALTHARESGAVAMEVRALSGIGDSYYAQGRMVTALEAFRTCVELCEQHELADIEASNRFMLATTRIYANQTDVALADALASAELGMRVGNRRAEIVSRLTAGWILLSLSRLDEAKSQIEQGLQLARAMGAARFEAFLLESSARVHLIGGQPELARNQIRAAWQIVERQRLHNFIGPWVLGTLALLEDRKPERDKALEQGLALLEQGCVGHNYYRFFVSAAEVCLLCNDVEQAIQYAERLSHFTAEEPCAWADHHIELIRRYGDFLSSHSTHARERLREQLEKGNRAGLAMLMPRMNARLVGDLLPS